MITDDPGTPAKGRYELNVAYVTDRSKGSVSSACPLFDLGYGLCDRVKVGVMVPWLMTNSSDDGRHSGLGDTTLGIKWRFLESEQLEMSAGAQFTFNTDHKSVTKGLVEDDQTLTLPVQIAKSFGGFDLCADCCFSFHKNAPNDISYGLMVVHEFAGGIEGALEYRQAKEMGSSEVERLVNLGMRFRLDEGRTLLISCGRPLGKAPKGDQPWFGYVGLQFHF